MCRKVMISAALVALLVLLASCGKSPEAASLPMGFDYARVAGPLDSLNSADRKTVEDTVALMKRGDHRLALVRLAALNDRNPSNASLRLLSSYALLQLGNLAESLAEAQRSHNAADHGVYQCYVLAHVATINGNTELARREIEHVNGAGDAAMKADMKVLSRKVETN